MKPLIFLSILAASGYASAPALAGDAAPVKPNLVLQQLVQGLPQGSKSEIRVMTATFRAGDKTPVHTHGFPVTVYVLEGEFTVEMKDKAPITIKAGEAMVEPPDTIMTGVNHAKAGVTKVVVFYVSTAGAPFLAPSK